MTTLAAWACLAFALAPGEFQVAGVVVNAKTGEPLSKVRLTLFRVRTQREVAVATTASDGRFQMVVLAPGKYDLSAERRGFAVQSYGQRALFASYNSAVVVGEGEDTTHLTFRMIPSSAIAGTVTDDNGDPLAGHPVSAYRLSYHGTTRQPELAARAWTDDLGRYRLHTLPRGKYLLLAAGVPRNATGLTDVVTHQKYTFPPTLFPGVTDSGKAVPVQLGDGEEAQADIRVRRTNAVTLTVNCRMGEKPVGDYAMLLLPLTDAVKQIDIATVQVKRGRAEFERIAPGEYELRVVDQRRRTLAREHVEALDDSTTITLGDTAPAKLHVTLERHGGEEGNASLMVLTDQQTGWNVPAQFDSDNVAEFSPLAGGRYDMIVTDGQNQALLRVVSVQGARAGPDWIEMPDTGTATLALLADFSGRDVAGKVVREGAGQAGMIVIAVPRNKLDDTRRYLVDQSDSDGSFTWRGALTGEYLAFVFENGVLEDYLDPAVIRQHLAEGRPVTIGAERAPVRLELKPAQSAQPPAAGPPGSW